MLVQQVHSQLLRRHALQLDAHEVTTIERVGAEALTEARRVRDLVDPFRACAQRIVLLFALRFDRGRSESAVDECLRFESPIQFTDRTTTSLSMKAMSRPEATSRP